MLFSAGVADAYTNYINLLSDSDSDLELQEVLQESLRYDVPAVSIVVFVSTSIILKLNNFALMQIFTRANWKLC